MKIKTCELTGKALDWTAGMAQGGPAKTLWHLMRNGNWSPSTDWSQGGPIIEREGILLRPLRRTGHTLDGQWLAMYDGSNTGTMVHWVKRADWPRHYLHGPTPLVAAMRCFVASKLGDEVDVPEELV